MKAEKWISGLNGAILAFLLSFGSMGCLVSGFGLTVSMATLALNCGLLALTGALCFLLKRGDAITACIFALVLGYLWRRGILVSSFETLVYEISSRYDGGYNWGVAGKSGGDMTAALVISASLIALCVTRTVCRRDTSFLALSLPLLPLLLCMVVTDTVPGEGYLFLLLLGMVLLLLTGSLRRSDPGQANTLTAMAALPAILALGLLFWLVPKDGYVNRTEEIQDTLIRWVASVPEFWEELTVSEDTVAAGDDRTPKVDLDDLGPRKQYTYAVMDVYSDTGGSLYLREQDYNEYNRVGWSYTVNRRESFGLGGQVEWEDAGRVTVTTKRVRDVVYYPYYPAADILLAGGCVVNDRGMTSYEMERYVLPGNWKQRLSSEEGTPSVQLPIAGSGMPVGYTKLPSDTREWAQELLTTILTDEKTDTEKADTIAAYVRNSAAYDLDTAKMDEDAEDFVRWFLEESDTGYCVHFATAAAVLLRAAGVDARYVTGYLVQARAGETVTVTAAQAHAWVEYYESQLDTWIVLEATPGDLTGGGPTETTEETETETAGETETVPQTDPRETESGAGTEATKGTEPTETDTGEPGEAPEKPKGSAWWLLWLLIPAGIWLQREVRLGLRRDRMHRGGANRRALALWREATLYGKILKHRPPAELEALAQKAKYSQYTLTTQELMVFDAWLRDARRRIKSMPWYLRLLYRLVYAV